MEDRQAVFRAYRLNQERTVYAYYMVMEHTIAEVIYRRAAAKRSLAMNIVDGDIEHTHKYTSEELKFRCEEDDEPVDKLEQEEIDPNTVLYENFEDFEYVCKHDDSLNNSNAVIKFKAVKLAKDIRSEHHNKLLSLLEKPESFEFETENGLLVVPSEPVIVYKKNMETQFLAPIPYAEDYQIEMQEMYIQNDKINVKEGDCFTMDARLCKLKGEPSQIVFDTGKLQIKGYYRMRISFQHKENWSNWSPWSGMFRW